MFKNYFIVAARNFWKHKVFSLINILGLAIGISASLVIYLLVSYHFDFDKFEKDGNRIYRVKSDFVFSGEVYHNSGVTSPMGNAVRKEITGIDEVAPFYTWDDATRISVPVPGKTPVVFKKQDKIIYADSGYFKLLNYEWVAGSPKTSLLQPYQVVLSVSSAKLYFPDARPDQVIGKEIYLNDTVRTTITGIVKDIPYNTDFVFKTFVSRITLEETTGKTDDYKSWDNTNGASQLYIKLSSGVSTAQVEKRIAALYQKYHKPEPGDHSTTKHSLQPLNDVHFNGDYGVYNASTANKPTLYSLLAVASFLLLLGCINFINLTTAQATQRAKEIGIRKTMGSSRSQLILQFLSETLLLTFIATVLSVCLTPLLLKAFAGFIPKELHFNIAQQPGVILFLLLLMVLVTFLSGLYPALILSGYKPVLVLKNQAYGNTGKTRNAWLRKSLTISQFVIAQVFIMGTILVSKQITWSINKEQGFKKDAILYVNTNYYDTVKSHKYVLIDKLKAIPEIAMVSLSIGPPSSNNTWSSSMKYKDGKQEIETDVQQKYGDSNYLKLYGLKLIAGTNIPPSDTVNAFLINETYARILGFRQPKDAIGKNLEWSKKNSPVKGVVADFHQRSMHEPIKPLVIGSWNNVERSISIALQPKTAAVNTWKIAISKIEKAWKEVYPEEEFEYQFFDEQIAKYYKTEQDISSLLKWSTGLAVFISCLGLLGLVIYSTNQRTKEIGVRKVLGATVAQVVALISKEFIILVLLAFVIAVPLAWMGMYKWLENFAYKTEISWWIFLLAGCSMLGIALITLCFQTIKAAMTNPVRSLRSE